MTGRGSTEQARPELTVPALYELNIRLRAALAQAEERNEQLREKLRQVNANAEKLIRIVNQ